MAPRALKRIARFVRFYGAALYRGTSMRWATPDGAIPFRLFFAMEAAMFSVAAEEELAAYHMTLLGVAQVMGNADGRSARDAVIRSIRERADD